MHPITDLPKELDSLLFVIGMQLPELGRLWATLPYTQNLNGSITGLALSKKVFSYGVALDGQVV